MTVHARPRAASSPDARLPGPRGVARLDAIRRFAAAPHSYPLVLHEQYGPIVEVGLGRQRFVFLADPEAIGAVLQAPLGTYHRDEIGASIAMVLGQGLLTSEGEAWRFKRKLISPSLSRRQITAYADSMVSHARAALERTRTPGIIDIHRLTTKVTLDIVVDTLFGAHEGVDADRVGDAMERGMHAFIQLQRTPRRLLPRWWPLRARREVAAAREVLGRIALPLIERKRRALDRGSESDDLLSRLIAASDDDGERLTDAQLLDEVITILAVGHDTTANTLAFACWLLATHAPIQERVRAEVRSVIGGGAPNAESLARLPYLDAVIRETLRLFPTAYVFGRTALADVTVAGRRIPAGTQLVVCPWALHRDRRFFPDPNAFDPERWRTPSDAPAAPPPGMKRHAFLPFGGGARVCVGSHFAMMEAALILAVWLDAWRFDPVPGRELCLDAAVALRPKGGLPLSARSAS